LTSDGNSRTRADLRTGPPVFVNSLLAITATFVATGLLAAGLTRTLVHTSSVLVLVVLVALVCLSRPLAGLLASLLTALLSTLLAALTALLAALASFLSFTLAELFVAAIRIPTATLAATLVLVRHFLLLLK
jgi:hypothetical protein